MLKFWFENKFRRVLSKQQQRVRRGAAERWCLVDGLIQICPSGIEVLLGGVAFCKMRPRYQIKNCFSNLILAFVLPTYSCFTVASGSALQVENLVVGAPCGVMDQMTSVCGQEGKLLALMCRPAQIIGHVTIPSHVQFWYGNLCKRNCFFEE